MNEIVMDRSHSSYNVSVTQPRRDDLSDRRKGWRTSWAVVLALPLLFATSAGADTADSISESDRELAERLWAGVIAERAKLKTGTVRITPTLTDETTKDRDPRLPRRVPIAVDLTFDHTAGNSLYRIDWNPDRQAIWMRTPKGAYGWTGRGNILELKKATDAFGAYAYRPDVRVLGISSKTDIGNGTTWEMRMRNLKEDYRLHGVCRVGDGLFEMSWTRPMSKEIERLTTIVINEAKGFTFEGLTYRAKLKESDSPWSEAPPTVDVKAKWEHRGGTWVPVFSEAREPPRAGGDKLTVRLEWKSVNKPVAKSVFNEDNLGIPRGVTIVDARTFRQGVIIGKVGMPEYVPPLGRLRFAEPPD